MKRISLSRIALVVALFSLAPAMGSAEAATSLSKTLTVGVDDDASFVVASKSGWIVGGTTFESSESSTVFTEKPMGGSDIWVTQLDASLNSLWSHRVGSSKNDIAGGITLDVNGNIWIIGKLRPFPWYIWMFFNEFHSDIWITRKSIPIPWFIYIFF